MAYKKLIQKIRGHRRIAYATIVQCTNIYLDYIVFGMQSFAHETSCALGHLLPTTAYATILK